MQDLKMIHHRMGPVKARWPLPPADKSGSVGTREPQRTNVHYNDDTGTLPPEG